MPLGGARTARSAAGPNRSGRFDARRVGPKMKPMGIETTASGPTGTAVLVVDDEAPVRSVAETTLSAIGCRVMTAANAEQALRLLLSPVPLDLLVTDIRMPRMDGITLAELAKALRPELRVLFTSAYLSAGPVRGERIDDAPFVRKPWRAAQLEQHVRRLVGPLAAPVPD